MTYWTRVLAFTVPHWGIVTLFFSPHQGTLMMHVCGRMVMSRFLPEFTMSTIEVFPNTLCLKHIAMLNLLNRTLLQYRTLSQTYKLLYRHVFVNYTSEFYAMSVDVKCSIWYVLWYSHLVHIGYTSVRYMMRVFGTKELIPLGEYWAYKETTSSPNAPETSSADTGGMPRKKTTWSPPCSSHHNTADVNGQKGGNASAPTQRTHGIHAPNGAETTKDATCDLTKK